MKIFTRATRAKNYNGKPAWHGQYRFSDKGKWQTVANQYGKILYTTPEHAEQGAKLISTKIRSSYISL